MKKLLSLLLSVIMLMGMFAVRTVSAEVSEADARQIKFLEALEIMESIDPSSYSAEVTRENFAYYAAKTLGLQTTGNDSLRRYIDVPTYSYAFSAINSLADAGIISESVDGRFRPNDFITFGEACTIMLNAMGYKEYAQLNGAWPLGYIKVARMLDMTIIDTSKAMTLEEVAKLIYEAVKSPLYDIGLVSQNNAIYVESDDTILSLVFSLEFKEGCFEAFAGGAMDSSDLTEENIVKISGENYAVVDGLDVSEYFGDWIEYFYYDKSGRKEIVYMHRAKNTKENIVIDIENFDSYKDNAIFYYTGKSSGQAKKITLPENHTILYNGMPLLTNVSGTLASLNKGTITIKDSNDDGKYDLIMIMDYKNFVVRMYDSTSEVVYDKVNIGNKLELVDKNYIKLLSDGEELPLTSLISDLVLSVAESQKGEVVTMLASGSIIKGAVQAKNAEYVTVDGTKYEVEKDYKDIMSVDLGMTYVFHLDSFGKIAYVSASDDRRMKFAYLIAGADGDDAFEDGYRVKMFTEDGEMVYLDFAKNTVIDGNRKRSINEIKTTLIDSKTGNVKPQLVEFELNGDGMIKNMDTVSVKNDNEDPNYSLHSVFPETLKGTNGWGQSGRYMFRALLRTQTVTIMIPEDASEDDKYYRIAKSWQEATGANSSEWWEPIDMYWKSEDSAYVDVIVKSTSTTVEQTEKSVVMVTEIGETLNEDEDMVALIIGIDSAGSTVTLQAPIENCDAGIDKGDLVVVSKYMTGETAGAKLVYDASAGGEPIGFTNATFKDYGDFLLLSQGAQHANYRHDTQISFGYAKKVFDEGIVSMSRYLGGDETERMIFPASVAVYDSEIDEVYVGSIADVMAYENGVKKPSKLFYHTYNGVSRGMFIYK